MLQYSYRDTDGFDGLPEKKNQAWLIFQNI